MPTAVGRAIRRVGGAVGGGIRGAGTAAAIRGRLVDTIYHGECRRRNGDGHHKTSTAKDLRLPRVISDVAERQCNHEVGQALLG